MTDLDRRVAEALRGWPDVLALQLAEKTATDVAALLVDQVELLLAGLRARLADPALLQSNLNNGVVKHDADHD